MRETTRTPLLFTGALSLLTIVALLLNVPPTLDGILVWWVLFSVLVAYAFNMGVLLTVGEISPAHLFGIMALLTLGSGEQFGAALWAVGTGGLLGSLIYIARAGEWLPRRRVQLRSVDTVAEGMAQLTLSLLVGGVLYIEAGGRLPLGPLEAADIMPLLALAAGFVLTYLLIFTLRVRLRQIPISKLLSENWRALLGTVLLPVPFGILGAVAANNLDDLSWMVLIAGLVFAVAGMYTLSRTQFHFRQQVEELSSLSAVSQALRTTLDLGTLLETVYFQVTHLLEVDNFAVALLDPLNNYLLFPLVVRQGVRAEQRPTPRGTGTLLEYVISQRKPLLIDRDVAQRAADMGRKPPQGNIVSWLGVPLLAPDRTLGAMLVASSDPERLLGPGDLRLLMNVAATAAVAIENAQLYGEAHDRALQLSALNNISQLLTGTLSVERVYNLIMSSMVAIANCDAVALYLHTENAERLVRVIGLSESFHNHPPTPLIASESYADRPVERLARQPVVVPDSHTEPAIGHGFRILMDQENKRAWVEIMLVMAEEPLGVVVAYYDQPRIFSDDEIELMRAFATQAALAIHNARLYTNTDLALGRRISQLEALYAVGQELTSILNLEKIFYLVLERALQSTHSEAGLVAVGTDDGVGIQVVAHRGYAEEVFHSSRVLDTSLTASVFDTGKSALLGDVSDSPLFRPLNGATRSQLSVPIRREQEILGVVTIESDEENAYNEDDINFVGQLAIQAAVAIDNARLFKRIAEGRDRLQVILDSMTEGVLLINHDGVVSLANPRMETLLGISPAMLVGRLVDDLLIDTGSTFARRLGFSAGDLRLLLTDLRAGQLAVEERLAAQTYALTEPRHVHVLRRVAPVQDESGILLGLLLVFVDETERQEVAQARDDVTRMIVHDLRGPLTAITASLKLLNDLVPRHHDIGPIVQQTTEASMRAVRKLLNLVDSLLDIAKMESGKITLEAQAVDLNAIAGNVIMEMDSLARELDVNLAFEVPYDLPLLNLDAEQVERVLLNLVDNALKFTPADGTIRVAAYPPGRRGASAGFVRVEVSDTGPGIPDEYKERLFDRFVQVEGTSGRRRGTGLGLTFCRLAVESHGGEIWVEDNAEGGAVFAFTLPVAEAKEKEDREDFFPRGLDEESTGPIL
ncbi:MAG: GAF domain-containing protein [Anaerolineae bacterium]|nr:GAF domain-containing protein [Anaerolineae bacterium]